MIIDTKKYDAGLVFSDDFYSRQTIHSQGGVISLCSVGNGLRPNTTAGRVTYYGTENLLINSTQATFVLKFKTPSTFDATARVYLSKANPTLTNTHFMFQTFSSTFYGYIATTVGSYADYVTLSAALAVSTEYVVHAVYNGSLAAGSRLVMYVNGLLAASSIVGTIPARMVPGTVGVSVFNHTGGSSSQAPPNDAVMRNVKIYNTSWSAEEVLDDYQNDTYLELGCP